MPLVTSLQKNITGDKIFYKKENKSDIIVALSGNPNVGKSTVFNALTGLHQHTGNWSGKTVSTAIGICKYYGRRIVLVDIPGSYSLIAHSGEEEIARDYICFGEADINVVVCDATKLERNLNLLLQICETGKKTVLCLNLADEAKAYGINIDTEKLSQLLNIPVILTSARSGKGLEELKGEIIKTADMQLYPPYNVTYDPETEEKIKLLQTEKFKRMVESVGISPRFVAIKLLEKDNSFSDSFNKHTGINLEDYTVEGLAVSGDTTAAALLNEAEKISQYTVHKKSSARDKRSLTADKILTGKLTGIPIMLLMLAVVFWITISGANYPSQLLSDFFTSLEQPIYSFLISIKIPTVICNALVFGVYRVTQWIVSVMLPPMAIFFPFFTILEDSGYLPRIAFNIDKCFKKCNACGKQALTMCMGLGCNAVGVTGCRIIDSKREKLIAILTNSLVPCNGRFPLLITVISIYFVGKASSFLAALILCGFIVLSVLMTFLSSFILSKTVLKGVPSSFTLELPSYRKPQILKVIIHSVFDRTLFVLLRALIAAAPAGLLIWFFANVSVDGASLLNIISDFLDPFGRLLGLDGVIVMAFILGLPANEIVIPLILMAYCANTTLTDISDLNILRNIFDTNGWTILTAVNVMIFSLFHWPCSTTLLTIKKETGSIKYTALAAAIPTVIGITLCFITNLIYSLFTG